MNDNKETVYAQHLTAREMNLLSSLVTHHIRTLEGLMETDPPQLPEHKRWMYTLEDKLEI